MEKRQIFNRLTHLRNSLVMGLAADVLFHDTHAPDVLKPVVAQMGDVAFALGQVADALVRPEARDQICSEFRKLVFRAGTAEPFEAVEKYAAITRQAALLEAASWYPFAKLLRNAIRHGSVVFTPYFESSLPITYRHITIAKGDAGRSIDGLVDYATAIRLADDILTYVQDTMV